MFGESESFFRNSHGLVVSIFEAKMARQIAGEYEFHIRNLQAFGKHLIVECEAEG